MAATYEPITTHTTTTAVATITLSSIPDTYTDLVLVANFKNSATGDATRIRFNGDTASNYSNTQMVGTSAPTNSSGRESNQTSARMFGAANGPTTEFSVGIININNYANTTTFKPILCKYADANGDTQATVGLWRATPQAITSITLFNIVGFTFNIGATFNLYGIKAA